MEGLGLHREDSPNCSGPGAQIKRLTEISPPKTLSMIPADLLHSKPIDLRHICLFYLGHIPGFLDIHMSVSWLTSDMAAGESTKKSVHELNLSHTYLVSAISRKATLSPHIIRICSREVLQEHLLHWRWLTVVSTS